MYILFILNVNYGLWSMKHEVTSLNRKSVSLPMIFFLPYLPNSMLLSL